MSIEFFFLDNVYPITKFSIGLGLTVGFFLSWLDNTDTVTNAESSKERWEAILRFFLWWLGLAILIAGTWFIIGVMFVFFKSLF